MGKHGRALCKHRAIRESSRPARPSCSQRPRPLPAVSMEARALCLLLAVLAVGSSRSSAQYVGLGESCSSL